MYHNPPIDCLCTLVQFFACLKCMFAKLLNEAPLNMCACAGLRIRNMYAPCLFGSSVDQGEHM